jgi:hypothetical protein
MAMTPISRHFALAFAALAVATPAWAQTPPQPKAVQTVPVRPAAQTPAETFRAMTAPERQAIQSDLAWASLYNGVVNGEFNDRVIVAIRAYQQRINGKQTGVLNPQERATLAAESKKLQDNAGWRIVDDMVSGGKVGIPTKLAPQVATSQSGMKWNSAQGQVQIETWRVREPNVTTAIVAEREKVKAPPPREVKYTAIRPDFFVLSGTQGLKKFYMRGQFQNGEVRGLTILYDQATEGVMEPVVIAMSSAFNPFRALDPTAQPRRAVEYSTGVIVAADGTIVADRTATDGCQSFIIDGRGNADRIAQDEKSGLTLLRIYGASGLTPLAITAGAAKPDLTLTGIADPQFQGGRNAVTSVATKIGASGNDLTTIPAQGFAGAPAFDADGKFAGLATLKPAVVAGPAAAPQGALISADAVNAFLSANKITAATGAANAKASVVRVICVRR